MASRVVKYFYSKLAAAAYNGGSYTLADEDEVQTVQIEVPAGKEFTLDLNGKTLHNTMTTHIWNADQGNWSHFTVRGKMTIKDGSPAGTGSITPDPNDCYAVDVREGGHLIIESGSYNGNRTSIYVHEGTAEIKGGKFSVQQQHPTDPYGYVIDCDNTNYLNGTAKALISGGSFVGFNPGDCPAEGPGTNFVIDGYHSYISDGAATPKVYSVKQN
ncbi:MAG: hypothetical protein GX798_05570 [Bacteroidales bacterium]|nr:hypothetical protein [Bacteroidales bacterium]